LRSQQGEGRTFASVSRRSNQRFAAKNEINVSPFSPRASPIADQLYCRLRNTASLCDGAGIFDRLTRSLSLFSLVSIISKLLDEGMLSSDRFFFKNDDRPGFAAVAILGRR
jgi:hypothetical protein